MDVFLNKSLSDVLADLQVTDEVRDALVYGNNIFGDILGIIRWYEKADWDAVTFYSKRLKISGEKISELYIEAINWAKNI
jgi:c-di-GMP-related signal transduction protein